MRILNHHWNTITAAKDEWICFQNREASGGHLLLSVKGHFCPEDHPQHLWRDALNLVSYFNTLRPKQNDRHFADDIFKSIFLNENAWIPIEISLKFVVKVTIDNIPALVQIMAWGRPGDKPLSEPMVASLRIYASLRLNELIRQKVFDTSHH